MTRQAQSKIDKVLQSGSGAMADYIKAIFKIRGGEKKKKKKKKRNGSKQLDLPP